MTKEHAAEFLNELTLGEVAMLAEMATKRREEMEGILKAEAEERFIQAYKDFRKLAPPIILSISSGSMKLTMEIGKVRNLIFTK